MSAERRRHHHVRLHAGAAAERPAGLRRHRLRRRRRGAPALGHRRAGAAVQPGHHGDELVPAADGAALHLHGLHLLRERHRRRPLPDLPRLVRAGPRRARHRDDRADGGDLGDQRPLGRRHGDRRHRGAARAAEARLRQDHGDRRDPGRLDPRHPAAALGGAGALRDDRPPAGQRALARRRLPRAADGRGLRPLHLHPLPASARARPDAARGGAQRAAAPRSSGCCAPASCPSSSSSR